MTIVYRVQSSPGREEARERLIAGISSPETEVIIDDGSPSPGSWIVPPAGPWRGYTKCLDNLSQTGHVVVIQDDAIVCRNFTQAVEKIVETKPTNVICLFVPGAAMLTARAMRSEPGPFCQLAFRDSFMPVVAVLWPVDSARLFIEWTRDQKLPGMPRPPQSDDAVAGLWRRSMREQILVTNPSLVQHPDDVESTIGRPTKYGKDKGRVAAIYIGDGNPLDIDWG